MSTVHDLSLCGSATSQPYFSNMNALTLNLSRIPNLGPTGQKRHQKRENEIRIVKYFDELRQNGHSDLAICRALADAVEQGRLQPNLFRYVSVSPPPSPFKAARQLNASLIVFSFHGARNPARC